MATRNVFDFRFEPTFVSPTRKQFLPGYRDKYKTNNFLEFIKRQDEETEKYVVKFHQLTLTPGEPLPIFLPFKELQSKPKEAPAAKTPCRFCNSVPP